MQNQYPFSFATATIAASGTLSNSINLGGKFLVGFLTDPNWTTAVITFEGSIDSTNFYEIQDNSDGLLAAASLISPCDPDNYAMLTDIKVRSGTKASTVAQTDAVNIVLILRSFPDKF